MCAGCLLYGTARFEWPVVCQASPVGGASPTNGAKLSAWALSGDTVNLPSALDVVRGRPVSALALPPARAGLLALWNAAAGHVRVESFQIV